MKIDILSDIHIDFYFRNNPNETKVKALYSHILTHNGSREIGNILIIAGDLGHNNYQNIQVLEHIKNIFGYQYIICVLGNHDYYLINNSSKQKYSNQSLIRVEQLRELINEKEGMYCLDGNIIEIEGILIGGCDSWYDGEYIKQNFGNNDERCPMWDIPLNSDYYIDQLQQQSINDANYIFGIHWQELALQEREKIERIYKDVDIMVTHVNPSILKEHTHPYYREEETTGFFTFDGLKYLKNGNMKYWIFGHTHNQTTFNLHDVTCICNPMGYPSENNNTKNVEISSIVLD